MHFFYAEEQLSLPRVCRVGGRVTGGENPSYLRELPNEVLLNVFPFKVVFHVQTAMHAIAKYCSSVSKKRNN